MAILPIMLLVTMGVFCSGSRLNVTPPPRECSRRQHELACYHEVARAVELIKHLPRPEVFTSTKAILDALGNPKHYYRTCLRRKVSSLWASIYISEPVLWMLMGILNRGEQVDRATIVEGARTLVDPLHASKCQIHTWAFVFLNHPQGKDIVVSDGLSRFRMLSSSSNIFALPPDLTAIILDMEMSKISPEGNLSYESNLLEGSNPKRARIESSPNTPPLDSVTPPVSPETFSQDQWIPPLSHAGDEAQEWRVEYNILDPLVSHEFHHEDPIQALQFGDPLMSEKLVFDLRL